MLPTYTAMGIGEGRESPPARGERIKMPTAAAAPRMRRPDDQSAAKLKLPGPPTNGAGLMMEVNNVLPLCVPATSQPSNGGGHHHGHHHHHHRQPPPPQPGGQRIMCAPPPPPQQASARLAPLNAIRCTVPSCSCECFTPGKMNIRYCDACNHSWVPHALDKLGFRHLFGQSPVEPVQPNVAFDIASLVLYGCQALPIRLKILLDRLFSVLQREEVLQVLHGFGWTHEDYARGYILQEPHGGVLDRWNICSPEEEPLVLQQFLRFGETRAITQQLLLAATQQHHQQHPDIPLPISSTSSSSSSSLNQLKIDSDIKKFIERTSTKSSKHHEAHDDRDRERERTSSSSKTLQQQSFASGVQQSLPNRTHKQRTTSPTRRPSPPTTVPQQPPIPSHHSHIPHHPHPGLHIGLHPTSQSSGLPPSRPPPPPPMSPIQKNAQSVSNAPVNFLKLPLPTSTPVSNGPCSTSSPPNSISSSPLSVSPLNRLQSMQPFDFRKMGGGFPPPANSGPRGNSPEIQHPSSHVRRRISEASDTSPPGLMNLSITSPTSLCLPPPPPPPTICTTSSTAPPSFNPSAAMAAAVAAGPLAAASLVASSLPGLISSVSTPGSKSPSAADFMSGGGSSEFGSDEDDDPEEENSYSALNLSRDGGMSIKSPRQHQRPSGHVRKATTPMKRQWGTSDLPLNLGTQLINPATGKKRVQCNVCLKTFCDKGALKIHFSAVHLREMHKCTVEGCNMMFSSRRSRNRHSANPNPKLHSPHLRRKISPHDGRSAQTHPLLIPPPSGLSLSAAAAAAALNPLSFSPFPLLTPPPELRHQTAPSALSMDHKQSLDLSMHRYDDHRRTDMSNNNTTSSDEAPTALNLNNSQLEEDNDDGFDDDEEGIVVDGGAEDDEPDDRPEERRTGEIPEKDDDCGTLVKRVKLSESDFDDMTSNLDSNEDSLSVVDSHSLKEENGTESTVFASKSVRKRKNQNPTRCAIPVMMSHNDLMSDEDSSSDVVFAPATAASEVHGNDVQNAEEQQVHEEIRQDGTERDTPSPSEAKHKEADFVNTKMEEDEPEPTTFEGSNNIQEVGVEFNELEKHETEGETYVTETEKRNDSVDIKAIVTPLIPADRLKKEKAESERSDAAEAEQEAEEEQDPQKQQEQPQQQQHEQEFSTPATTSSTTTTTPAPAPVSEDEPKRAPSSAGSQHSDESLDSSHALRQLESLSHGHFGGQSASSPLLHSQHFPSLGFIMGGTGPPSPEGSSVTSNGPDSPSEENSQNMFFHDSGGFIGNMDVPIDKDNPRRCTACGKIFQNHFGVKTHFQNVHLKLMHKCTVEGCNAAFPSKRSRDRHSANLNLHRKLLSTSSSEKSGGGLFLDKSPFASLTSGNPSLHSEFLARLYAESQSLPLSLEAFKNLPHSHPHLAPPPPPGSLAEQMLLNGERLPPPHPSLLLPPLGFSGLNNFASHLNPMSASMNGANSMSERRDRSSGSNSPVTMPSSPRTGVGASPADGEAPSAIYSVEEDMPTPDRDGFLPCGLCHKALPDAASLKEHCELQHLSEMYRCTVPGCEKVFTSRTRRNLHSENEALHQSASRIAASDNCS